VCAVENDIKPFDPITLDNNPVDEPREWKVGRVKKYCARNVPGLLEYIEKVQNDPVCPTGGKMTPEEICKLMVQEWDDLAIEEVCQDFYDWMSERTFYYMIFERRCAEIYRDMAYTECNRFKAKIFGRE